MSLPKNLKTELKEAKEAELKLRAESLAPKADEPQDTKETKKERSAKRVKK